jgi:hypothetical protein
MTANHYLESLGQQFGFGADPSTAEVLYALACVVHDGFDRLNDTLVELADALHVERDVGREPDPDHTPAPDRGSPPPRGAVGVERP